MVQGGELFALVFLLLGVCTTLLNSYQAWFKPQEFIKKDQKYKDDAPEWKRWFARSTSVTFDLWLFRLVNVIGFISSIFIGYIIIFS